MFSKIASVIQSSPEKFFLIGSAFSGRVLENLVHWNITQQFQNHEKQPVELLYHFPLGVNAALVSVSARIGNREFSYQVSAKSQARMDYTDALTDGDTAILLEQDHELRYFMRLGNILPGEQVEIELQTVECLLVSHGSARVSVPTCVPNSYCLAGNYSEHPVVVSGGQKHSFSADLKINGDLRQSLFYSPSHKLRLQQSSDALLIQVAGDNFLDRDFVLNIDNIQGLQSSGLWFQNPNKNDDLPGDYIGFVSHFAQATEAPQNAIQLKILLDCSGSMDGERIESAKSALKCLIPQFRLNDRISFSRFGSTCENLLDATALVTSQLRQGLGHWIDETEADFGGTEMADAVNQVAKIAHFGTADILLITDGEVEGLAEMLAAVEESNHRVFVLAIGANPQESLLSTLARKTGGAIEFIQQDCDIEAGISRLFTTLRSSSYGGVSVHCDGLIDSTVIAPKNGFANCSLPVLFSSNVPLFDIALRSERKTSNGDTRFELSNISCRLIDEPFLAEAVCKLWALRRFEMMADESCLAGGASNQAATELAVRFELITPLTAACMVLLRDEAERNQGMPNRRTVPSMVAADRMYGGRDMLFCRSVTACADSYSLPANKPIVVERSPQACIDVLNELPAHLVPTSFKALLVVGVPQDVIDWCKQLMAVLLHQQGEAAVVERMISILYAGNFGDSAWIYQLTDCQQLISLVADNH